MTDALVFHGYIYLSRTDRRGLVQKLTLLFCDGKDKQSSIFNTVFLFVCSVCYSFFCLREETRIYLHAIERCVTASFEIKTLKGRDFKRVRIARDTVTESL